MDRQGLGSGAAVIVTAAPTPEETELRPLRSSGPIAGPSTSPRPASSRRWPWVALALVLPLGLLALWQLSTSLGWFTAAQLPAPGTVLQAGINLFDRGLLVKFVAISTQRVLVGFSSVRRWAWSWAPSPA